MKYLALPIHPLPKKSTSWPTQLQHPFLVLPQVGLPQTSLKTVRGLAESTEIKAAGGIDAGNGEVGILDSCG